MLRHFRRELLAILLVCAVPFQGFSLTADQVPVRHTEGLVHGFLTLRTLDGKLLADGEMAQVAEGGHVKIRTIFRFKDGSVFDETTIFSQRDSFQLVSDHLVQRGPSFKRAMDTSIEASTGQVTVHYTDKDGKEKTLTEKGDLPPDIANENGLLFTLVKNIQPNSPQTTVPLMAATPKPRMVKLAILPKGTELISSGNLQHETVHYLVKVKIGGVAGLLAPLLGKQPPDINVWVLTGKAPTIVKSEGPLYQGGPIWRIELATG
jgi:hypothetical protein